MRNIGININSTKDKDGKILEAVQSIIKKYFSSSNIFIYKDSINLSEDSSKDLNVVIALGGDGTILRAARALEAFETPILGVNIGHLGFLSSVELHEFEDALIKLKNNEFTLEDRMMLKCTLPNRNNEDHYIALNDLVISKGTLSRVVNYDIYIDDTFYINYNADGLIISTPTGSTAYSLSAGGPIVYPTLDVVALTPICPISFGVKTIILDSSNKISIKVKANNEKVYLTSDGQMLFALNNEDEVLVQVSSRKCRLIKFSDYNYFKILRKKIISRSRECEGENL